MDQLFVAHQPAHEIKNNRFFSKKEKCIQPSGGRALQMSASRTLNEPWQESMPNPKKNYLPNGSSGINSQPQADMFKHASRIKIAIRSFPLLMSNRSQTSENGRALEAIN